MSELIWLVCWNNPVHASFGVDAQWPSCGSEMSLQHVVPLSQHKIFFKECVIIFVDSYLVLRIWVKSWSLSDHVNVWVIDLFLIQLADLMKEMQSSRRSITPFIRDTLRWVVWLSEGHLYTADKTEAKDKHRFAVFAIQRRSWKKTI